MTDATATEADTATTLKRIKRSDAIKAAEADINYFRLLCTPQYPTPFPDLYVAIFNIIREHIDEPEYWLRFVLALPRGHLKTTYLECINAWFITYTHMQSFLIVANTVELSEGILASIMDLLSSDNYIALFGHWKDTANIDNSRTKEFYLHDKHVRVHTSYSMGKVRGGKRVERYQFITIDDAFSREDADSPTKYKTFIEWLNGTLLKGRHAKRAIVLYAGNKYPTKQCVVTRLSETNAWVSILVGAILPDGTALMPHVRSLKSLLQEFADDDELGLADSFLSEMMNGKSSGMRSGLDLSKMPPPLNDDTLKQWGDTPWGRILVLDPATDKETADQIAISVSDIYTGNTAVTKHLEECKLAHDELARHVVDLALTYQVPCIVYEDVGYQHILGREIENVLEALGIYHVAVLPIQTKNAKKVVRIRNFLLKHIVPTFDVDMNQIRPVRHYFFAKAREVLMNRLEVYDITKSNNVDDVMDVLAYTNLAMLDPEMREASVIPINVEYKVVEAPVISTSVI